MSSREAVSAVLGDTKNWNQGERELIAYLASFGQGSFFRHLTTAAMTADESNLLKLYKAFPELCMAVVDYRSGALGERLREAGVEL